MRRTAGFPPRFESPESGVEEQLAGWLYPDFLPLPKPLSIATLAELESYFATLPPPRLPSSPANPPPSNPRTHIYVCTHGSRDCRCGDLGEPLYQALVREARWRKIGGAMSDGTDGVRISRVSHIGGHKYAANALVYKEGGSCDWYGHLRETDVARLLDEATSSTAEPWWPRWRGRLGLKPEEARAYYIQKVAEDPSVLKTSRKRKEKARVPLGDPVELLFKSWDGEDEYRVTGFEGESVMWHDVMTSRQ
ncbi:hypothetical protein RQP46_011355 [Phenoliferia psychrophenolica]